MEWESTHSDEKGGGDEDLPSPNALGMRDNNLHMWTSVHESYPGTQL